MTIEQWILRHGNSLHELFFQRGMMERGVEQGAILDDWRVALCPTQSVSDPFSARKLESFAAQAPGTTAAAMLAHGIDPRRYDFNECDVWWFCEVDGVGRHRLIFEGLTPPTEIFLDNERIGASDAMFSPLTMEVELFGPHLLALRFPALLKHTPQRKGRAKWRTKLIQPNDLRHIRVSALGHMPVFGPDIAPIGPWRPVRLTALTQAALLESDIRADFANGAATIEITLNFDAPPALAPIADCEGNHCLLQPQSEVCFAGSLTISNPKIWRPGHPRPHLYDLRIHLNGQIILQENIGFRTIEIDRGADGRDFKLIVNGEPIFCRGAVWTPLDAMSLQNDPQWLARQIDLIKRAGFNMLRVAGPFIYESENFYRACDEAGILIWQDFMFANFDYPAQDLEFLSHVEKEVSAFLRRVKKHACLAVLCGGSEVYQQGAMFGLPKEKYNSLLFESFLPDATARENVKTPYVVNSPSGGDLPFRVNEGVAHYYGVGAYMRPLEDARRANVRFASECLGFANIPENHRLLADFGPRPLDHPLWSERIARDAGASITFETVRDFYIELLYGPAALALKTRDPELYFDFSRAAVAEAIEATLSEWRRPGSTCHGALIWHWKDLAASIGWGIVDWRGTPKSAWHGARRACQPLQILLSDEGVNGLHAHVLNEAATPFEGSVRLECFATGAHPIVAGEISVNLAPHSSQSFVDSQFWGSFFDASYAYRFGPPAHIVSRAALIDAMGDRISQAWFFPNGRGGALLDPNLIVEPFCDLDGFGLTMSADVFAQSVRIDAEGAIPLENWLHLAPLERRTIRFLDAAAPFCGVVRALNGRTFDFAIK